MAVVVANGTSDTSSGVYTCPVTTGSGTSGSGGGESGSESPASDRGGVAA